MRQASDYALGDEAKDYCRYCAHPDGSMQNYEEKLESMTAFLARSSGFSDEAARSAARTAMASLPAWAGRET